MAINHPEVLQYEKPNHAQELLDSVVEKFERRMEVYGYENPAVTQIIGGLRRDLDTFYRSAETSLHTCEYRWNGFDINQYIDNMISIIAIEEDPEIIELLSTPDILDVRNELYEDIPASIARHNETSMISDHALLDKILKCNEQISKGWETFIKTHNTSFNPLDLYIRKEELLALLGVDKSDTEKSSLYSTALNLGSFVVRTQDYSVSIQYNTNHYFPLVTFSSLSESSEEPTITASIGHDDELVISHSWMNGSRERSISCLYYQPLLYKPLEALYLDRFPVVLPEGDIGVAGSIRLDSLVVDSDSWKKDLAFGIESSAGGDLYIYKVNWDRYKQDTDFTMSRDERDIYKASFSNVLERWINSEVFNEKELQKLARFVR